QPDGRGDGHPLRQRRAGRRRQDRRRASRSPDLRAEGGKLELVGVEYIVIAAAGDAANKTPPTLMGQLFHLNSSPNRYGIPAFYALHVWAWRHNPQGTFVDYNSRVSCDAYPTEAAR